MKSGNQAHQVTPIVRAQMPELDTVRGIAVLMVFVFHAFGNTIHPEYFHGNG